MKNKDKILEVVEKSHCGITATGVFEKLSDQMDKTTVYRNLEKLSTQGIINEEFDVNGERKYSNGEHHHHHFVCNSCGKKINIGCFFSPELKKLEKKEKITITNHSFLLGGLCSECKK